MDNIVLHIETDNTVIIANKNTTIGYATVDAAQDCSLIFLFIPIFDEKAMAKYWSKLQRPRLTQNCVLLRQFPH